MPKLSTDVKTRLFARRTAWVFLEKASQQIMMFAVFAIVARDIGPGEFGIISVCFIFIALAQLQNLGLSDGIVALRIEERSTLSAIFLVILLINLGMAAALYLAAAPIAALLGMPEAAPYLRWLAPLSVLSALQAVPNAILQGAMEFRKLSLRTTIATFGGAVVGIGCSRNGLGAYSLIAQQIVQFLVANFIVWKSISWRPTYRIGNCDLWSGLKPGLRLTAVYLIEFCETQIPRLLVALVLGPISAGYYAFGGRIWQAVKEIVILPIAAVLFPTLIREQNNAVEFSATFNRALVCTTGFVILAVAMFAGASSLLVGFLFGEKWLPATQFVSLFMAANILTPIGLVYRNTFRALNRLGAYLRIQCVIVASNLIGIYIGSHYGLNATLGVTALSYAISIPLLHKRLGQLILSPPEPVWRATLSFMAAGFITFLIGRSTSHFLTPLIGNMATLALALPCGLIAYIVGCRLLGLDIVRLLYGSVKLQSRTL
ncbi:oligosaccharide flippase family protein [Cupriavidus sp. SK-4]|uniref:oligosaccharide flippase family protein n=1 Tax=Cupriavidus sp. SK-4 TaxID=574750 RepID=UPI000562FB94|nr:oligosaccharide flippase family protein [Cupriavidus sp. SK-4]